MAPTMALKTSAMGQWAARLAAYAGSDSLRDEQPWWQAQLSAAEAQADVSRNASRFAELERD